MTRYKDKKGEWKLKMNALKKNLINNLINNHLGNADTYLNDLYREVLVEDYNYRILEDGNLIENEMDNECIINIIKNSTYNDILILRYSNMKDYNKAINKFLLLCRDKIKKCRIY